MLGVRASTYTRLLVDPTDRARAWIRVVRDAVLVVTGVAMFATVLALYITRKEPPNLTLLGAAAACLGLGVILREGEGFFQRNGNGKKRNE